MTLKRSNLPQGMLNLLILKVVALAPVHRSLSLARRFYCWLSPYSLVTSRRGVQPASSRSWHCAMNKQVQIK